MTPTKSWSVGIMIFGLAILAASPKTRAETWKAPSESWQTPVESQSSSAALKWEQRVLKRSPAKTEPVVGKSTLMSERDGYRTARRSPTEYDQMYPPDGMRESPPYENQRRMRMVGGGEPEVIPPGIMQYDPVAESGIFADDCAGCGGEGCDPCFGAPQDDSCDFGYECFDGRCSWWIKNLTLFAGGMGFKGPVDLGLSGNYGIHEGLGISGPLGDPWGHGYQMGARFAQSNLGGKTGEIPGADRSQYFVTAGIFRRNLCQGFQWGVVWDYMHDRYFDTFNLSQIRTDVGYVVQGCGEIGFMGTFGVKNDTYDIGNFRDIQLEPTDMFALYFRRYFETGGEGRLWGGATSRGDGLFGADIWVPLGRGFALQNSINYKISREGRAGGDAAADESWGMMMQLVWYPGKMALNQRCNPYRPLQNVADNSLFMVEQIVP